MTEQSLLGIKIGVGEIERALEDFQLNHKEIEIELKLKRSQVMQLRKDFDEVIFENHSLKHELGNTKNKAEEFRSNFNLALKKCSEVEEKLKEKTESLVELQLKLDLLEAENESLRVQLIKEKTEKSSLIYQCEDLKSASECHLAFQNDLRRKEFEFKSLLSNVQKEIERIEKEQNEFSVKVKEAQTIDEKLEPFRAYKEIYDTILNKNADLERELIKRTAKLNKLEEIVQNVAVPVDKMSETPNQPEYMFCKENLDMKDQIINKLLERLAAEEAATAKLLMSEVQHSQSLMELEEKIKSLEKDLSDIDVQTEAVNTNCLNVKKQAVQTEQQI